jgi:hypothetical protein
LHIDQELRDQFKTATKSRGQDMSTVVEKMMGPWIEQHSTDPEMERVQLDQAVTILVKAVCAQLDANRTWATEAILDAGMGLPGCGVFNKRIGHFSLEKQECGRHFARWLLCRIIGLLSQNRKVFLVCDSGTTVFWFLKALGELINEYFKKSDPLPIHPEKLSLLTLVTNNIPGAEAFVAYASQHPLPVPSKRVLISDLIECRLLAGLLLPEYVALTGADTDSDLEAVYTRISTQRLKPAPVFIGVATGNWLNIVPFEGKALPQLLARGRGHGPFKKKLLQVCDEVFVIAPLGKIFLKSVDELNNKLRYSDSAAESQLRSYEVVGMPEGKATAIKLVSTYRDKISSVMRNHSQDVREAIGKFAADPERQQQQTSLPIEQVEHLLFKFDDFSDKSPEAQIEIELPHQQTRTPEFEKLFFNIR